jgi:hypothetical protein
MSAPSQAFAETALYHEAQASPRSHDPEAVKLEIAALADSVLGQLGARAPAPIAGEGKAAFTARIGEALAAYGPEERRSLDRRSLPFREVAEVVRADLAYAEREIAEPLHSLKDGEVREVIRLDDSGRPMHTFHSRTEGPSFWMNAFREPVLRFVSRGSDGIATERRPPAPGHEFSRDKLPEYREIARREAYAASPEFQVIKAYADAGLPPPSAEILAKVRGK